MRTVCLKWLLILALSSCGQAPEEPSQPALEIFKDDSGTEFQTALGSSQALPPGLPQDWFYPGATVHSSGQIADDQGGIASLLLTTPDSDQKILNYYRDRLWFGHWQLLSESTQDGVTTAIFEYAGSKPEHDLEQLALQVGALHQTTAQRDILLLWSWVSTAALAEAEATPPPEALDSDQEALDLDPENPVDPDLNTAANSDPL